MAKLRFIKSYNQYQIDYYRNGKRTRRFLGSDKKHAEKELRRVDALVKAEKLGLPIAINPSPKAAIRPQNYLEGNFIPTAEKNRIKILKAMDLYIQRCREAAQSGHITEKTYKTKMVLLKGRFSKFFQIKHPQIKYLDEIQKTHIESYRAFRLNSRNQVSLGKKIKPNSFNTDLRDLIAFFNYCIENESIFFLQKNPASKVGRAHKVDKNEKPPCLTPEQIKQVFRKCSDDIELRNVIEAFLETGMRYNELRNLRWQDIDLEKGLIHIKSRKEFLTKTRRSRTIPLSQRMRDLLKKIPRRSEQLFDLINIQKIKAKKDNLCNIRKRFDRVKKQLSFLRTGERFHIFRHTAITRWTNSGVPLSIVQKWAGHSSVEMTMKYVHPSDDESISWMKKYSKNLEKKPD